MANFELFTTRLGIVSIKNLAINQIMHNPLGPVLEAQELYLKHSKIKEKLLEPTQTPLVIYDVGLGGGANAIAALNFQKDLGSQRPIELVSFENDFSLLTFALSNAEKLSYLAGYEEALNTLRNKNFVAQNKWSWKLIDGDLKETIRTPNLPPPEIIFYDVYSPQIDAKLWGLDIFSNFFKHSRKAQSSSLLVTYSRATAVRSSLLSAGYYVGISKSSVEDMEATIASTDLSTLANPLNKSWLSKLEASSNPWPSDTQDFGGPSVIGKILRSHPQFS